MDMKLKYERPETINFVVEMEAGFCAGSGDEIKNSNVTIETEEHIAGDGFDVSGSAWE